VKKTRKASAKSSRPISPQELIARAKKSNEDYRAGREKSQSLANAFGEPVCQVWKAKA